MRMKVLIIMLLALATQGVFAKSGTERLIESCNRDNFGPACSAVGIGLYDLDPQKAVGYLSKACDLGEGSACSVLGYGYLYDFVPSSSFSNDPNVILKRLKNLNSKGLDAFQKGCKLNNEISCYLLGTYYTFDKDKRAVKCMTKACNLVLNNPQNNPQLLNYCGVAAAFYYNGVLVEKSLPEARKILQRVCRIGMKSACNDLAQLDKEGKADGLDKALDGWLK